MLIQKYDEKMKYSQYVDDEQEKAKLCAIIVYLRDMRILHKDALLDIDYMATCYSDTDQMNNRGGMSLVSQHYFKFAVFLISLIREEVTEEKILKRGSASYTLAIENIFAKREVLQTQFDNCHLQSAAVGDIKTEIESIEQQQRDEIFDDMVKKTLRSIFKCVMKKVRENTTSHYASGATKDAHRATLRHKYANDQMKTDGKRADEAIKKRKLADIMN